jgi:ATP-binding cassette subfamily B protein RaxB
MDEGTAHLDSETEEKVLRAVAGLDITRIVVAHRSRAIEAADRVALVSGGRILGITTRTPSAAAAAGGLAEGSGAEAQPTSESVTICDQKRGT